MIEWKKLEGEKREGSELFEMNRFYLSDFENGDQFVGRPQLGGIEGMIDFNNQDKTQYVLKFNIVNAETKEYLSINIKLKDDDNVQRNVYKNSSLFALVNSISWILDEYWENYDIIKEVNLINLRNFINSADKVTVEVVEREADFGSYNSFRVLEIE